MTHVWQAKVIIEEQDHFTYDELLSTVEAGVDLSKKEEAWQLTAYIDDSYSEENIRHIFQQINNILGTNTPLDLTSVPQSDWKESLKHSFPPVKIGSFFIHSFDEETPAGMVDLKIPAGLAFGTGEHPTTAGCLTLLEKMLAEGCHYTSVLDMGCGSSILAMAAAKKLNVPCTAVDIDKESVETANRNIQMNSCAEFITCAYSDGYGSDVVQNNAPYDLIFSNILANPLIAMADDLDNVLENGGTAILSGFTEDQKDKVVERYVQLGLTLSNDITVDGWVAVALTKAYT